MFDKVDLGKSLKHVRAKHLSNEDKLLLQAQSFLKEDLYSEKKILEHLSQYNRTFEDLDENLIDNEDLFHPSEIKKMAVTYRLKFLETKYFKPEIPFEAIVKIKHLHYLNKKEIRTFRILAPTENFSDKNSQASSLLFAKTNNENYFLVHQWGKDLSWFRKIAYLPLRKFENLVTTVFLFTLLLTLSLPTPLITLDDTAQYWSGYRAAAFFHLLIFNFGVTVYFTFTLAKNFSTAIWNQYKDFD